MSIRTYTALSNQNIYDICLMTYGILDQLSKLMQDNNFGSVNNYPYAGQQFTWDDTLAYNLASNQSNTLSNVNYATGSDSIGNINYSIQSNGLPINGSQIVSPVTPEASTGTGKYDYYLVYNNDARWSGLTFTDPYLIGKSGYAIYVQQNSQFFSVTQGQDVNYNSINGSFTIISNGFSLLDGYYLVIYPNKYDTTIP
jgi:hypothetical protein